MSGSDPVIAGELAEGLRPRRWRTMGARVQVGGSDETRILRDDDPGVRIGGDPSVAGFPPRVERLAARPDRLPCPPDRVRWPALAAFVRTGRPAPPRPVGVAVRRRPEPPAMNPEWVAWQPVGIRFHRRPIPIGHRPRTAATGLGGRVSAPTEHFTIWVPYSSRRRSAVAVGRTRRRVAGPDTADPWREHRPLGRRVRRRVLQVEERAICRRLTVPSDAPPLAER